MDIGSLLLALALLLLVAAFIARPVVEQTASRTADEAASAAGDLITQREAILIELRELDFDHAIGKISDDDHAAQRARLVARGAELLRLLDKLPADEAPGPAGDLDAEIERLVSARRKPQAPAAARRQLAASARCPSCRRPTALDDKFCPHCGAKLAVAEAAK
jgi:hypothetical protein